MTTKTKPVTPLLILLWVTLTATDCIQTLYALNHTTGFAEANPAAASITNPVTMVTVGIIINLTLAAVYVAVNHVKGIWQAIPLFLLLTLSLKTVVVLHNFGQLT